MNQRDFQDRNGQYLKAAFGWLRARLDVLLAQRKGGFRNFWLFRVSRARRLATATRHYEESLSTDLLPALTILVNRFRSDDQQGNDAAESLQKLRTFEQHLLLLCVAAESNPWIARCIREFNGRNSHSYPTFALAQQLFADSVDQNVLQQAMAADGPLRYYQLIEIHQPDGVSLSESRLSASDWLLNIVHGRHIVDELLLRLLVPLTLAGQPQPDVVLSTSQREAVDDKLEIFRSLAGRSLPIIQLVGPNSFSKRHVARYLANRLSGEFNRTLNVYRLPGTDLPGDPFERNTFLRLWERELIRAQPALYVDLHDTDLNDPDGTKKLALKQLVERAQGIVILDTRTNPPQHGRSTVTIEVNKPRADEQFEEWQKVLNHEESSARLAGQFDFDLGTIRQIAASANDGRTAWEQCLQLTRPRLDNLAQPIETKAQFDDLILPQLQKELLSQISKQVRHRYCVYDRWKFRERMNRGLGISVLFAGDSGTGKTMAAEAIANKLELPLYRIDLSAVVNKYIGETEKNLRRMFDAFEDGGAVLLFDEADSLFGKRSEVKDSHDRYANIQIDYLLQRLEAFTGLAILATNMKSALDQAFLRRLRFVVDFPMPGVPERRAMWEHVFPHEVFGDPPQVDLDFAKLAKFNLTGGNIQTIAINAAGLAAAESDDHQRVLRMEHVLDATRNEFRKLDRPINESDFRWRPKTNGELVNA